MGKKPLFRVISVGISGVLFYPIFSRNTRACGPVSCPEYEPTSYACRSDYTPSAG